MLMRERHIGEARGMQSALQVLKSRNPENKRPQGQLYLSANRADSSAAAFTVRQGS